MIIEVELDYSLLLAKLEERKLTDAQIYKKWGIPRKTLYNIKHGNGITVETLAKLAYILDASMDELVTLKYNEVDVD